MRFSLFLLLFLLLLDEAEQIYLIPHTPLYPIYQLSLETNRQPVLFMTIDTFFFACVSLRTFHVASQPKLIRFSNASGQRSMVQWGKRDLGGGRGRLRRRRPCGLLCGTRDLWKWRQRGDLSRHFDLVELNWKGEGHIITNINDTKTSRGPADLHLFFLSSFASSSVLCCVGCLFADWGEWGF